MPFRSKKQMRYLLWKDPELARKWYKHTPNVDELPETANKKSSKNESYIKDVDEILNEKIVTIDMERLILDYLKGV